MPRKLTYKGRDDMSIEDMQAAQKMPYIHTLKCHSREFLQIMDGDKTFELRKNDRPFSEQDYLMLLEFRPERERYTGKHVLVRVTHIMTPAESFGALQEGYVAMSIERFY